MAKHNKQNAQDLPEESGEDTAASGLTAGETPADFPEEPETAEKPAAEASEHASGETEPEISEAEPAEDSSAGDDESVEDEVERLFADEEPAEEQPEPAQDTGDDDEYDEYEEYDEIQARKKQRRQRKRKKRRKKGRGLSCSLVLLTLIFASATVLSLVILTVVKEIYGIDKDINERSITIPPGATTVDIAEQLEHDEIISLPQMFRLISRMNGKDGSYIAGDHIISPSMSYQAMIEELCTNHEDTREHVRVTFREGITLLDAATLLEENEICKADAFLWAFNAGGKGFRFENELSDSSALKFYRMEGYCFPDTYDFYVGEDVNIVVQKIYENFDKKITPAYYSRMEEMGYTLDEVITLASIVQAEASSTEVMKKVASVFHNRLINSAVFPQLQSTPTGKYAQNVIKPNQEVPNTLMLDAYDTDKGTGLPPGAINNPGKAAIEAVLYPEETNYYFFYANIDTGETFFATTNAEHEANKAKVKQQQAEAAAND